MKIHTQMQDTYNINDKISFVGLGKLGLPLATIFAKNGTDVIGIDKNKDKINLLNENKVPFYEEGLKDNLRESRGKIKYTSDYNGIMGESDISIILVNTQIGDSYSSKYVVSRPALQLKPNASNEYFRFKSMPDVFSEPILRS